MAVIKVTSDNFAEIKASDKPVLLDFFATWCGPCAKMSPLVDEVAEENSNIVVGKIDVDEEADLAAEFGIMSIPTLVVLKNGEIADKAVGVVNKAKLLEMIQA